MIADFLSRLKSKDDPNLNRWEKKLVHENEGVLYTWENLTTPYQKKGDVKVYPKLETEGQYWEAGAL